MNNKLEDHWAWKMGEFAATIFQIVLIVLLVIGVQFILELFGLA